MKKQTKKAAAKATTNPKGLKKIISDYEANVMIAEELVSIIETGDYSRWTKNWHYLEDLTDLYYYVIDGKGAANVFTTELLTYVNTLVNDIPAGFYAEMRQIKARGLHLVKGAKGIPSYQLRFFYKELTAAEENYIKEDEELSVLLENLIRNHDEQFKASFDYINEKGQQRHFDEVILWDNYKNQPAYQRAQYVLIYLFNINDIKEGVDVKKYWQVGDRKPCMIMANGQKAILCPIMWNEDWNSEEEKPQYNPEEELKEENPVKTVKNLQSLGASAGMAVFMAATQQDSNRYKVEWAHYRYGDESKGESYTVDVEHNETEVFTSLDKAMAAYKAIKRNSHYKGYRRWIQISVSSDEGKTYTGSYFHDTF